MAEAGGDVIVPVETMLGALDGVEISNGDFDAINVCVPAFILSWRLETDFECDGVSLLETGERANASSARASVTRCEMAFGWVGGGFDCFELKANWPPPS